MKTLAAVAVLMILSAAAFGQQPVNNAQVGGSATATAASGVQKVGIVGSTGTALDGTSAGVLDENIKNVGGSAASTAASGVLKVGIVGNSGSSVDVAQGGGTAASNAFQEAGVFNTTLPTLTNGQGGAIQVDAKAQQLIDLNYVGGAAIALGNGTASGAIRVAVASDNTAFGVNAAESGNWTTRGVGNAGGILDGAVGSSASSAAANALQVAGQFLTSPPTLTTGQMQALMLDNSGKLLVNCTGCSGASTVSLIPHTTGGLSVKSFVTAGSDNATNLKASAGQVYSVDLYNNAAYPIYFKLYNASSSPTGCGATNLFATIGVQAGTQYHLAAENGFAMGTGISYCVTKGIATSDDTAVLASDGAVNIGWN